MIRFFLILLLLVPSVVVAQDYDTLGCTTEYSHSLTILNYISGAYYHATWSGTLEKIVCLVYSLNGGNKMTTAVYEVDSVVSANAYLTKLSDSDSLTANAEEAWRTFTLHPAISIDSGHVYFLCAQAKSFLTNTVVMRYNAFGGDNAADSLLTESGHTFEDLPATEVITNQFVNDVSIYALGYRTALSTGQVIIIGSTDEAIHDNRVGICALPRLECWGQPTREY